MAHKIMNFIQCGGERKNTPLKDLHQLLQYKDIIPFPLQAPVLKRFQAPMGRFELVISLYVDV